jgi:copper chaperone CopZ
MSLVSKLPGRLRFKIKEIFNKKQQCSVIELKILEINGVMKVEANHRTSRLLVVFDEAVIDSHELALRTREILDEMVDWLDAGYETQKSERKGDISSATAATAIIMHAVIDIAGHMLMPKPFNILFPIAVNAMRKNL